MLGAATAMIVGVLVNLSGLVGDAGGDVGGLHPVDGVSLPGC